MRKVPGWLKDTPSSPEGETLLGFLVEYTEFAPIIGEVVFGDLIPATVEVPFILPEGERVTISFPSGKSYAFISEGDGKFRQTED